MKHCTTCGANFVDDDLRYCTDDGTVLLPGENPFAADAQATKIYPDSRPTEVMSPPRPTEYGVRTPEDQPPAAPLYRWANEAPASWTPPAPPAYPGAGQQQQTTAALLSLIFGILAITIGWICFGIPLGIVAVILGLVALAQVNKDPAKYGGKPLAIGGLITGGIVALVKTLFLLLWIVAAIFGSLR